MFRIVTDTSANLPTDYLHAEQITVIPYTFQSGKGEQSCMDLTTFDAKDFYAQMRSGVKVTTSQIPPQRYIDVLTPLLEAGIHIRKLGTPPAPHGDGALIVHPITPQPIGVVTIYPGISADVVRNFLLQPVKALILRSYGVGNAPQNAVFLRELAEASSRGIVVVNLTQCMSGKVNMGGYATGNALAQAGVIGGADMTVEATLTKLHYLLSQGLDADAIRAAMQQNLRGELTPDD